MNEFKSLHGDKTSRKLSLWVTKQASGNQETPTNRARILSSTSARYFSAMITNTREHGEMDDLSSRSMGVLFAVAQDKRRSSFGHVYWRLSQVFAGIKTELL